jgi:hypothetical protein
MNPSVSQALSVILYLVALALGAYAARARGFRLIAALFVLAFGVGSVNVLIEAVVFGVMTLNETVPAFIFHAVQFAIVALVATAVTGKLREGASSAIALRLTPVRIGAVALGYVVVYFAAGMLVYPYVKEFYAGRPMPGGSTIIALQIFRGLIYLASAIPLLRLNPRFPRLVLGIAFPLIAGLAPLVADNAVMPAWVRAAHAIEITSSNFIFGVFLAWLIMPRAQKAAEASGMHPQERT